MTISDVDNPCLGVEFGAPVMPTSTSDAMFGALVDAIQHHRSASGPSIMLDDFGRLVNTRLGGNANAERPGTISSYSPSGIVIEIGRSYYLTMRDENGLGMFLIALFACVFCADAAAQFARSEGTFQSNQLVVHVVLLDPEKGVAAASVATSQGACSGTITGIGNIASKKLTFEPYVKLPGGDACMIAIEFDAQWQKIKVTENGVCTSYHGSGCSWTGQVGFKEK